MKSESSSKLLLFFVGLIIVGIIFLYIVANNSSSKKQVQESINTYNIVLKGNKKITIEQGESFKDPGYEVLDSSGFIVYGVATVKNDVNTNKPGKYTISYMIDGEVVETREVVVIEKKTEDPIEEPKDEEKDSYIFKLVGDEEVNVLVNTLYYDEGATAKDKDGKDYTSSIVTNNKVDTTVVGKYEITYRLKKNDYDKTITRVVNVVDIDAKFSLVGENEVQISKGTMFNDPGCVATYKGVDYSSKVKTTNNIEKDVLGDYKVTYTFETDDFIAVLERKVKVIDEQKVITFELIGVPTVEVIVGETYNDAGYTATDQFGNDYSGYVTIENYLDISTPGTYKINYHLKYLDLDKTISRTVKVLSIPSSGGNNSSSTKPNIDFHLNGASTMSIAVGTKFADPGFVAKAGNDDFRDFVTISGYVNTRNVGTYTLTYTLNYNGEVKTLTRTVKVTGAKYTVTQTKGANNSSVTITIKSNIENFSHFMTSNYKKYTTNPLTYTVKENGTYSFFLYDKSGAVELIKVNVTSIVKVEKDTTKPKGTCTASVSKGVTKYVVNASDAGGIANYKHNGQTYGKSTFSVTNDVEDDTVRVTDKAGNYIDIVCEYPQITSGNKSVLAAYSSSTLKYWIEKPNTNYTVTHIWVKDAYNQMNIAVNNKFGTLENTKTMVNNTISKYGYSNKGMIAINASGFIMNSGDSYENYVKAWRLSSRAPVIFSRGSLVRDFTGYSLPGAMYPVYGLKKNGYLASYSFGGGSNSIAGNKKVLAQMKADGIRNSMSFPPVIVTNYKAVSSSTDHNLRQAICQVDRNNFIIITNVTSRSAGFNFKDMANYMVSLNCRTGFNLDGGGSINLYYKKNNSTLSSITTTSRKIADILYFVEK